MLGDFWTVSLTVLWGVVFVNLLLTVRIVRWARAVEDADRRSIEMENVPELPTGAPAPAFSTKTLAGEPVNLASYAGRSVTFVFTSPLCGSCRDEMPLFVRLGKLAESRMNDRVVLVSDQGIAETNAWINTIQKEDNVKVDLQVLVARPGVSRFFNDYNPRGWTPYFCSIDSQGTVQARGLIGSDAWSELLLQWETAPRTERPTRPVNRYR